MLNKGLLLLIYKILLDVVGDINTTPKTKCIHFDDFCFYFVFVFYIRSGFTHDYDFIACGVLKQTLQGNMALSMRKDLTLCDVTQTINLVTS